uniref:BUD13 homolog n=1 Tax=Erigeron canadensis TaxID=72917 RepID=UPI001CB93D98|nr:BUD13 homolog [Erigeron canadensis]
MVAPSSGSNSLKEYLKRYESNVDEEKKKKKKRKKTETKSDVNNVLIVDEPVWQKPVQVEVEDDESQDEEKPQVNEDIEVKRIKRLEERKNRRPFGAISEDGSGWVPVSENANSLNSDDPNSDISPPRKRRARNDTPSPGHELDPSRTVLNSDISPPHKQRNQNDTPSPEPHAHDMSPPRKRRARFDTPSPEPNSDPDLSPPRKGRTRESLNSDISPPRNSRTRDSVNSDLSPPRRGQRRSSNKSHPHASVVEDLSPPRKKSGNGHQQSIPATDLSPPRRTAKESERPKTGLVSGKYMKEEIAKTKKADFLRFQNMDPSISGRGAEGVRRDKRTGQRMTKEQIESLQKKDEKPKEIKLEWGKGLAQKREAEERWQELELEKSKPFARTRDDPDLDKMLKDTLRWGDPMAHLVKKKHSELVLPDMGDNERMKESGFIVPQEVPKHSWLKRRLDAAPNRYGITPGRHWDGVDRSNGFEKQMFNRKNEKQATEREAYLWSVADM